MIKNYFLLLVLLFTISTHSQIVINEIDVDTPGVDDKEFIELKSAVPNFSLCFYFCVFIVFL